MIELSGEQLKRLLPLFDFDLPNRTTLLSLMDGLSPGVAVVDDAERPTACLAVADFYGFSYVGGTPEPAWLAEAVSVLRQKRTLVIASASWLPEATTVLPEASIIFPRREFLHPQKARQTPPVPLPPGFSFRPLDAELLERCLWRDEMVVGYHSIEAFLAMVVGVCLMHGDELCCETYALFPAEGHYEIGVITHEAYRGKGFAHATCVQLTDECARRGFATSWSCNEDNPGSLATARKLGYTTEREYQFVIYARQG
jgi:RimJ/RimL family protein N-acetyltransferase